MQLDQTGVQLDIGPRIRRRRRALFMTLQELADKTELTPSSISQLERGKTSGSIKTLGRLAEGLGITVSDLFADKNESVNSVINLDEIATHEYGTNASKALVTPKSFNHMEIFVGHLASRGHTGREPHTHGASEEVIVVLEGTVQVTVGEQAYILTKHQAIALNSSQPHKVEEVDAAPASIMWVISPPSV